MSGHDKRGFLASMIGPKRRWVQYKRRASALPTPYRQTIEEVQRYLMHFVPSDAENNVAMFEDLADLFERAAAERKPVRDIVGEEPSEFADTFAKNFTEGGYVPARAKRRLIDAVSRLDQTR